MNGIIHFETFILAGLLLNPTPGNDTNFILNRSTAQGKKAGIVSVFGIATSSLVHRLLAALGLSLVIARSMFVFSALKFAGAAHLVYIGFQMFAHRSKVNPQNPKLTRGNSMTTMYRDALITNVLNPKVAMFFIFFLLQFIAPSAGQSGA